MTLLDTGAEGADKGQQQPPPADKGAPPPDWLTGLPEDIRGNPSLARYKDGGVEALARGYLNAERLIGGEKVPIPRDDNDAAAWDNYYRAGGRPDQPEQYDLQRPEQLPEGVAYDEQMEAWWRQAAHKSGLSKRQFNDLYESYRDRIFASQDLATKAAKTEVVETQTLLRRDWGATYDLKMQMANAEFEAMPEDIQAHIRFTGLNRKPGFIKYLAETKARVTGEIRTKGEQGRHVGKTPEQLQSDIAEHREKHAKVLVDKSHPEHALRVKELTAMFEALYPQPTE